MVNRVGLDDAIAPESVLAAMDNTTVLDDKMNLVPTAIALRAIRVHDLTERIAGLKPKDSAPHPLTAQIEFTQRCNLSCNFCYNSSSPVNSDELDLDTLERVCDELIDIGIVELVISGGEPLIRPGHVRLILEKFSNKGIPIHLLTNGLLLTHKTLDWLKRYNVVTIQVSLDGADPETHDRQRGMAGAWAKSVAGIARAGEHGFHTIVACTLTRYNADSIGKLIDYCYLLGAKEIHIGDLITWGRAVNWMDEGACTNEQFDSVTELAQSKYELYKGHMDICFPVNMLFYICRIHIIGQESILIRGNGDIIPHCTLSSIIAGNIYSDSIRDVWENKLKSVSQDGHLFNILDEHEIVCTERLKQLRCFRKMED